MMRLQTSMVYALGSDVTPHASMHGTARGYTRDADAVLPAAAGGAAGAMLNKPSETGPAAVPRPAPIAGR